jgi:hypothetical protein
MQNACAARAGVVKQLQIDCEMKAIGHDPPNDHRSFHVSFIVAHAFCR